MIQSVESREHLINKYNSDTAVCYLSEAVDIQVELGLGQVLRLKP